MERYHADPMTTITDAAMAMCSVASKICDDVVCDFNGIEIVAKPGDYWKKVAELYYATMQERDKTRWSPPVSLRDYFAGQALTAMLSSEIVHEQLELAIRNLEKTEGAKKDRRPVINRVLASRAYQLADAMLVLREKPTTVKPGYDPIELGA